MKFRFTIDADINIQRVDALEESGRSDLSLDPTEWSTADFVEAYTEGAIREVEVRSVEEVE